MTVSVANPKVGYDEISESLIETLPRYWGRVCTSPIGLIDLLARRKISFGAVSCIRRKQLNLTVEEAAIRCELGRLQAKDIEQLETGFWHGDIEFMAAALHQVLQLDYDLLYDAVAEGKRPVGLVGRPVAAKNLHGQTIWSQWQVGPKKFWSAQSRRTATPASSKPGWLHTLPASQWVGVHKTKLHSVIDALIENNPTLAHLSEERVFEGHVHRFIHVELLDLAKAQLPKPDWISLYQAAQLTGVKRDRLRNTINQLIEEDPKREVGRAEWVGKGLARYFVHVDLLKEACDRLPKPGWLSLGETAAEVGVSKYRLETAMRSLFKQKPDLQPLVAVHPWMGRQRKVVHVDLVGHIKESLPKPGWCSLGQAAREVGISPKLLRAIMNELLQEEPHMQQFLQQAIWSDDKVHTYLSPELVQRVKELGKVR